MKYDILLITETVNGGIDPSVYELMEFGRILADSGPFTAALVVPGSGVAGEGEAVQKRSGIDVIALENPGLRERDPDLLVKCAEVVTGIFNPSYVCFLHTVTGSAVAPAAAAGTGSSCITAVESTAGSDGSLTFRRSVLGGRLNLDLSPREGRVFLTVLPGAFPPCREWRRAGDAPRFTSLRPDLGRSRHMMREVIVKEAGLQKLVEAEVVISAGRGIGTRENIALLERIAALFKKSAIGASRPVCDMGWLPYAHQVGSTGRTVSPRLYMACGISGSPQHLAGMKDSGMIVSINRDPDAAITSVAHYIITDDLIPFLTLFEEMCLGPGKSGSP